MKLIYLKVALATLLFSLTCIANMANAGLISHAAGTKAVARHCPQAQNYASCWSSTQNTANKRIDVEDNIAENFAASYNSTKNYINTSFSGEYYSLPEVHLYSDSDGDWANFLFSYSYQEYIWTGGNDTLTISSEFTYTRTDGSPSWSDLSGTSNYTASLTILRDITDEFNFAAWKPVIRDQDVIKEAKYNALIDEILTEEGPIDESQTDDEKIRGSISTSFSVSAGDRFYVMSHVTAMANNGGKVNSANSLYTSVSASNSNEQQIALSLSTIKRPDPTAVPEPSTLVIFVLGMMGLASRRFKKQA